MESFNRYLLSFSAKFVNFLFVFNLMQSYFEFAMFQKSCCLNTLHYDSEKSCLCVQDQSNVAMRFP